MYYIIPLAAFVLLACDFKSKPYLKHDLAFEKMAGDCYGQTSSVSVNANVIGERFVFQECLDASFDGAYTVERKGDTVEVRIGKRPVVQSLYKITLDINTRPAYKFLTINGQTMAITIPRN